MIFFNILIFIFSFFILWFSSQKLVEVLSNIAKFLGWKEFVVAFLTIALGASLPNFFVGLFSVANNVPELSFGEIVGGNIVDLSLAVGLAAIFSKNGIVASSKTVQGSLLFTVIIATLPILLVQDGVISHGDGILLLLTFFAYLSWLFSKEERFKKIYDENERGEKKLFILKEFFYFFLFLILLLLSARAIVHSAKYFAFYFHLPLFLIGILFVGLGNALPEITFSIRSAKMGKNWFLLGNLMGSVIITATLVLGIVSLFSPIKFNETESIVVARIFLLICALFFFFFFKTERRITKKEGYFLIFLYLLFFFIEIFLHR